MRRNIFKKSKVCAITRVSFEILCSFNKFFFFFFFTTQKMRSTGIDLQNSACLWWVFGACWICIPLFNSNFLESRHPLSSHLCVYSDTQSLALWSQSSWLMMRMRVCVTCMSCTEGVNVSLRARTYTRPTACVWFSVCTWRSWLPKKAYWWRLA